MKRSTLLVCGLTVTVAISMQAQTARDVAPFVSVNAPILVLNHVKVIDGTGAEPKEDQAVVIAGGKITSIGPAASVQVPAGAQVVDRTGFTVIPGIVGMHDHLYYTDSISVQVSEHGELGEPGLLAAEIPYTAPRLYLAAGVTTMRTTGSVEPYTDLKLKERIDSGLMPGPAMDASAPYLEGPHTRFSQMHELTGPDDAKRLVDYWAGEGMTSFKAYMNITRQELGAAIQEAHAHKMKLTGHLCSVTWPEAIALGIDDLEHGPVFSDTEFVADKKVDLCPQAGGRGNAWSTIAVDGPQVKELISNLVSHHVAMTSTLPVFESGVPLRPRLAVARDTGNVCGVGAELLLGTSAHTGEFTHGCVDAERDGFRGSHLSRPADYCWPVRTRPGTAACYLDSGISARWNCWLKPDSRRGGHPHCNGKRRNLSRPTGSHRNT